MSLITDVGVGVTMLFCALFCPILIPFILWEMFNPIGGGSEHDSHGGRQWKRNGILNTWE